MDILISCHTAMLLLSEISNMRYRRLVYGLSSNEARWLKFLEDLDLENKDFKEEKSEMYNNLFGEET